MSEFLIVGSGLTGATIARVLHDAGRSVLITDSRSHIGGNVHDHYVEGVKIHTYGPHYFRTSSQRVHDFITCFCNLIPWSAEVKSNGAGVRPWPLNEQYIEWECGKNWKPARSGPAANFEEAALNLMPKVIYDYFIKGYTEKQWGVKATELSAELCTRFTVHKGNEQRFSPNAKWQGIPDCGYAELMRRMVAGIPLMLNSKFNIDAAPVFSKIIYTGSLDSLLNNQFGKLKYRGQHRTVEVTSQGLGCLQLNNPGAGEHIRKIDWSYLPTASKPSHTVITTETPYTPTDPDKYEYPFPDEANKVLHQQYVDEVAQRYPHITVCGRLGCYKYFDMDVAIERAFRISEKFL